MHLHTHVVWYHSGQASDLKENVYVTDHWLENTTQINLHFILSVKIILIRLVLLRQINNPVCVDFDFNIIWENIMQIYLATAKCYLTIANWCYKNATVVLCNKVELILGLHGPYCDILPYICEPILHNCDMLILCICYFLPHNCKLI